MKKLMPSLVGVMFGLFVLAVFVGIVSMALKDWDISSRMICLTRLSDLYCLMWLR